MLQNKGDADVRVDAQADTQADKRAGQGQKGEWQGRFVSALKSPETPTPGFINSPLPPSPAADQSGGQSDKQPSLNTADRRFAVYRNNVFSSLVNSMGDGFPVVQKLVGEAFFTALASAYVRQNLPTSPVMYFYGDNFGDFIDGFAPAASTPYLGDVARLEYEMRLALAAKDVAVVQVTTDNDNADAKTKQSEAEALLKKTAELHPSVRIMSSPYPIYSIWLRNTTTPDQPIPTDGKGEHVLIWRRNAVESDGYVVEAEALPQGGVEFFTAIAQRQPVYQAAEAATAVGGSDYLPHLLQRMLSVTTKLENPANPAMKETT